MACPDTCHGRSCPYQNGGDSSTPGKGHRAIRSNASCQTLRDGGSPLLLLVVFGSDGVADVMEQHRYNHHLLGTIFVGKCSCLEGMPILWLPIYLPYHAVPLQSCSHPSAPDHGF